MSRVCGPGVQEKERTKKEKEAAEAKYKFALVDGRKEQARACGRQPECPNVGSASCDMLCRQSVAANTALKVGVQMHRALRAGCSSPSIWGGQISLQLTGPPFQLANPIGYQTEGLKMGGEGGRWATSAWNRRGCSAAAASTPRWA